jgi:hypothetical protein
MSEIRGCHVGEYETFWDLTECRVVEYHHFGVLFASKTGDTLKRHEDLNFSSVG